MENKIMLDYFDDYISRPRVSVKMEDADGATIFKIALPGLSKSDIRITVRQDVLLVSVLADMGFVAIHEYKFQLNPGSVYLPEKSKVIFEDGLLDIGIPKDTEKIEGYSVVIS